MDKYKVIYVKTINGSKRPSRILSGNSVKEIRNRHKLSGRKIHSITKIK